ncbi:hypothetical protein KBD33_04125 [Candidatus Gracilibacteria bacterium]|nr:hypothetical protein [Candidatus Gracilibacteria bacterium]
MFPKKWTLYSPLFDAIFFFGPFVIVLVFSIVCEFFFPSILNPASSPLWFFVFAIFFDVGHVWGTLYRGYLQKNIFKNHANLLIGVPLLSIGVLIFFSSFTLPGHEPLYVPLSFLAYFAVFHFMKQQIGFMQLYAKKSEKLGSFEKISKTLDNTMIWIATGFPFIYWLMNYDILTINWFTPGEFSLLAGFIPQIPFIWILYILAILIYSISQLIFIAEGVRMNPLKYIYLLGTAYVWFNGMVLYDNIIIFGLGNILLHGINYYGIIIGSTFKNIESYNEFLQNIKRKGGWMLSIFIIMTLGALGFIEEFFWDQFFWQERSILFSDILYSFGHNHIFLIIVFSLLGSIQLTHYILDRYIWRGDFGKI